MKMWLGLLLLSFFVPSILEAYDCETSLGRLGTYYGFVQTGANPKTASVEVTLTWVDDRWLVLMSELRPEALVTGNRLRQTWWRGSLMTVEGALTVVSEAGFYHLRIFPEHRAGFIRVNLSSHYYRSQLWSLREEDAGLPLELAPELRSERRFELLVEARSAGFGHYDEVKVYQIDEMSGEEGANGGEALVLLTKINSWGGRHQEFFYGYLGQSGEKLSVTSWDDRLKLELDQRFGRGFLRADRSRFRRNRYLGRFMRSFRMPLVLNGNP